ncbi:amidohydrolase family protein, partial [Streptomyces sp. S6]
MRGELLALKAGHVFDGARVGPSGMLLVENDMILDVDFTGSEPPAEAATVDFGPDAWLLPGFVDTHVHLCWDGTEKAVAHGMPDGPEAVLRVARENAARSLDAGVTTVRDLGDRDYLTLELRDSPGEGLRPEIVVSAGAGRAVLGPFGEVLGRAARRDGERGVGGHRLRLVLREV